MNEKQNTNATTETDHSEQTRKNNALMLKMDRERNAEIDRRARTETAPEAPVSVQHLTEWQYDAYSLLQSARCALNGHRDKPTVALADKWIGEAMEALTKDAEQNEH